MKKKNIFKDKIVFQYANFRHDISIKWLNEPSMPTDTNLFPIWIIEIALTWLKNFSCIQQLDFPRNTNAQPEVCVCFFFRLVSTYQNDIFKCSSLYGSVQEGYRSLSIFNGYKVEAWFFKCAYFVISNRQKISKIQSYKTFFDWVQTCTSWKSHTQKN